MGTKYTIDYEDPTNLKDVVGVVVSHQSISHFQGSDINASTNLNATKNPACFKIMHASQAASSPNDAYMRVQIRLQIDGGQVIPVTMVDSFFMNGYSYIRPFITSSNPIIYSGDNSGQYTMELIVKLNSTPQGSSASYGRTELYARGLYAP